MSVKTSTADRRVQRTRIALRDALIALLEERGWDDINILDLCERADVGRSTFYLHFQNKEELLTGSFDDLRKWLRSQSAAEKTTGANFPCIRGLIDHAYEQRNLFRSIIGKRSGHVVQKRFREMVNRLMEEEILAPHSAWQQKAGARFLSGALVELLAWWVDSGKAHTAEEIEQLFYQLAGPVLMQLETSLRA